MDALGSARLRRGAQAQSRLQYARGEEKDEGVQGGSGPRAC